MNEIVNRFLLVGDKFLPEMLLNNLVLLTVLVVHLPKTNKGLKSLCNLEIQTLFIKMNLIKLVSNMIWHMGNQKV